MKNAPAHFWLSLLALLFTTGAAFASTVVSVHDGDTFMVNTAGNVYKVRLWAVDAPELGQPGCAAARDAAAELLKGEDVKVLARGTSYGRTVGQVLTAKGDLSLLLLRDGLVLLDERYSKKLEYRLAQSEARVNKRGLWGTKFTPPWVWRKQHSSRGKGCL